MSIFEDFLDTLDNLVNPQREVLKALGRRYGLRASEVDFFERLYPVWQESNQARKDKDRLKRAVAMYYPEIRRVSEGDNGRLPGIRRVARRGEARKYVIFSDHHMLHRGHRHDYFHTFRNRHLYKEVLEEYAKCGYTLVENGDVEELLIMEPSQLMVESFRACLKNGRIDRPRMEAVRAHFRAKMLDDIINDNEDLYDHINTLFHRNGRYVRLTGNHDTYLDENLIRKLRGKYRHLGIHDVLSVHAMDPGETETYGNASWLITHGHQFDTATVPLHAQMVGELNSETLSWIYEGPDRKWDWNDDNHRWISGHEKFYNRLAKGHPENFLSLVDEMVSTEDGKSRNAFAHAIEAIAFNHEIAWEYFERSNRWDALTKEVWGEGLPSGNEFFKIRHLSEEDVCRDYNKEMWEHRGATPNLVFGHTHEPRHNALCSHNLMWTNYFNSGSAGRFENLIFAVEIENGEGRIVSWHNDGGPSLLPRNVERRIWTPKEDKFLVSKTHQKLCIPSTHAPILDNFPEHPELDPTKPQFDPGAWSGHFEDPNDGPYYPYSPFLVDDPNGPVLAIERPFEDPNLSNPNGPVLDPNGPNGPFGPGNGPNGPGNGPAGPSGPGDNPNGPANPNNGPNMPQDPQNPGNGPQQPGNDPQNPGNPSQPGIDPNGPGNNPFNPFN